MPETDVQDILIVDDEDLICFVLTHLLRVHGFASRTASRGDEALRLISDRRPDLVIMDIRMPGMSGFDVLAHIRARDTQLPVILMTALYGVRDAVDAMRAGAFDYIAKPFNNDDMIAIVRRALAAAEELASASAIPEAADDALPDAFATMGSSLAVRRLAREAQRMATADNPVMIVGEIGTGKRHVARILHALGGRGGPFMEIDCTGADELLLRRELYGLAEQPGFRGKFELAREGTLLLDEAADIPWSFQDLIAEDLDARRRACTDNDAQQPPLARILLASSISADRGIDGNHLTRRFRALFGDDVLEVPPLRDRREDIPFLAEQILASANAELNTHVSGLTEDALERLVSYHWPGNVHQLKSVIRRATLTAKDRIEADDIELPMHHRAAAGAGDAIRIAVTVAPLREQVRRHVAAVERQLIFDTLQSTGWNKARASRLLGVTYKTLLKKVGEHGIERV
jgi:DNA-binding NtrC family response regulator